MRAPGWAGFNPRSPCRGGGDGDARSGDARDGGLKPALRSAAAPRSPKPPPLPLSTPATGDLLGSEKWGVGPSALALRQTKGGFTYGVLVNHIWSVAGEDDRADISSTFLQPFLSRGFPGGRTLSFNFESSYDWKGENWNVPLNINYSKVTKAGSQLLSLAGGVRYYFETPGDGPDWGVRFTLTLLYPEK